MATLQSTPLEVEFDRSVSGGIQYMKSRMRETQESVVRKNQRAAEMEEKTIKLKEGYRTAILRQNKMRRQIYEGEEKLEFVDRHISELQKRVYEKEEYLRELYTFKHGDSIQEAARMDEKLLQKKQLYKENYDKFQKGRQRKIALEQRQELLECRARAVNSKLNALTSELHHLKLGQERKAEESEKTAENAILNSSEYEKLEADMDIMRKRMMGGSQRVNNLTMQIANKETEIRSMKFNRLEMETTIKNILRKVQEQIERSKINDD